MRCLASVWFHGLLLEVCTIICLVVNCRLVSGHEISRLQHCLQLITARYTGIINCRPCCNVYVLNNLANIHDSKQSRDVLSLNRPDSPLFHASSYEWTFQLDQHQTCTNRQSDTLDRLHAYRNKRPSTLRHQLQCLLYKQKKCDTK